MNIIKQLITAFIILIEAGGVFRVSKLILDIMSDPESASSNLRKIKNVIIFMVLAIIAMGFKDVIMDYYGIHTL